MPDGNSSRRKKPMISKENRYFCPHNAWIASGYGVCVPPRRFQPVCACAPQCSNKLQPDYSPPGFCNTFSAAITACEKGRQWQLALELLHEMKAAKVEPNVGLQRPIQGLRITEKYKHVRGTHKRKPETQVNVVCFHSEKSFFSWKRSRRLLLNSENFLWVSGRVVQRHNQCV